MAYLTTFRKHGVGPGNWSAIPCAKDDPEMDRLLDLADATLTSWKEAYDIFQRYQQEQEKVDSTAFFAMRRLVHREIGAQLNNTETSYPNEAITYALLQRWIKSAKAEREVAQAATP